MKVLSHLVPFLGCLFLPFIVVAQPYKLDGRVIDSTDRQPLAFVNIVINDGKYGNVTDIDGKFHMTFDRPIETLTLSYVGYKTLRYQVPPDRDHLLISLVPVIIELRPVEIFPGVNPAHRIILNVISHRDDNDPEKMKSFSYTTYDKMYFTPDMDSIFALDPSLLDSSMMKIKSFFDEKYLFLMETVTQRKFLYPGRNYEKVVASRVSGFKNPTFIFLLSQMQSTSFYKEIIQIADKNYINPISTGSIRKYSFSLEDTLYKENSPDTTFVISYHPYPGSNFDGLRGLLYINTNGWAIENVIAEPARAERGIGVKIQQMYEWVDNTHWFPVQLNTDLIIYFVSVNADSTGYPVVGTGKSYIRDIVLNPELVKRGFGNIEIDVDPLAYQRPEPFWQSYRTDGLTRKDTATYHYIDSIGQEYHFDRIARTVEIINTGRIPVKFVNLDLNRIFLFNNYEGFYLGLGLHTNDRLSHRVSLGGYWGYGFDDATAKYGADVRVVANHDAALEFGLKYMQDVTESGGTHFFDDYSRFSYDNLRDFLLTRMDRTEQEEVYVGFMALRYMNVHMALDRTYKIAEEPYYYGVSGEGLVAMTNEFHFTTLSLGFRYAYREKFLKNARTRLSLGTHYPVVWFNYTRGLTGILDGGYAYNRCDIKIHKSWYIKYLGEPSLEIRAGYIDRSIPYTDLYNGHGSYQRFTIFVPHSFATIRMNEFLSDRYVALYFTHNFGKLLVRGRYFNPAISVSFNAGCGELKHNGNHYNIEYRTMEKGYYETGLLINNLLDVRLVSLGAGAYYRLGPYGFDHVIENFAFKLSVNFPRIF